MHCVCPSHCPVLPVVGRAGFFLRFPEILPLGNQLSGMMYIWSDSIGCLASASETEWKRQPIINVTMFSQIKKLPI
jgi:hypothetical protein